MNQSNSHLPGHVSVLSAMASRADDFIDLDHLFSIAKRHWRTLALAALLGLVLGAAYLIVATRLYTASTQILLDQELGRYAEDNRRGPAPQQMDSIVLNEIEILKSARLARTVVLAEKLEANEDFVSPPVSIGKRVKDAAKRVFGLPTSPELSMSASTDARISKAIALLQESLAVERVGRSSVILLSFQADDPRLAGAVTRAYAKAYLLDQLDANFDATRQATVWLQDRLTELRLSSQNAALEVEKFRAENGLTSAGGELISDQQLSDLNSQLILAQAETAKTLARYNQFKSIIEGGVDNAVQNATISNADQPGTATIVDLKQRYLAVRKREQEVTTQFGADHPQAVSLRREEQDLTRQIFAELQQLTDSYRNEYEVAKSREDSLRTSLGQLTGESSKSGNSMVRLRALEQQALALSTLYQTFLTRYEEASQQSSFPIAKARVISEATDPVVPSSPRNTMALALFLVLGLFAGAAIVALREFKERFFRTSEDVSHALGLKFLGHLPRQDGGAQRLRFFRRGVAVPTPSDASHVEGRLIPPSLSYAVNAPASSFAETLRNSKIAADISLESGCKVIGFVSVLPHEGKTTTAANFASLMAATGHKTLLIDADLRNPGLSRRLLTEPSRGLLDCIVGDVHWHDAVVTDAPTGLAVIPSMIGGYLSHTSALLSGPGMRRLLEEARRHFDYIVVDLPPLGPVVDAKAFEPLADGFILVAEWGQTPRALVRSTLQGEPGVAQKLLGVVLNKTDMKLLQRYGSDAASDRYIERYAAYYHDEQRAAV